jgi:uncharacterized protein YkwD
MLEAKKITLTLISLLFIGCGGGTAPTTSSKNTIDFQKPENQIILDAINQARATQRDCHDGLGLVGPVAPLTWNNELYAAAYEHSSDMLQSNTFDHLGSGTEYDITGSNNGNRSIFYERIEANGYVEYRAVGENIAGGQDGIEKVMEAWLNSPDHCTNIMSDNFKEVAVAVIADENSEYGIYWTQNFGSKK